MTMRIDELWNEMEEGVGESASWLVRLAQPDTKCPLFAALEKQTKRRAVLLRLPAAQMPARRHWPHCRGLEPVALEIEGAPYFGVILKARRFADVFATLAQDLIRQVAVAETTAEQAQAFLGQLARWQKFLTASFEGLSHEAERGLWGELYALRQHLLPGLGPSAVSFWKGPEQAHQDFQFPMGALEVKTTLAKQPQIVRISSERQLDGTLWPALFLQVLALETRDGGVESLPAMVAAVRKALGVDGAAVETFEDRLIEAGYLDAHAGRYDDRGYIVRTDRFFHVTTGFPAITEKDLQGGVGAVSYGLAVEVCEPFATSAAAAIEKLSSGHKK